MRAHDRRGVVDEQRRAVLARELEETVLGDGWVFVGIVVTKIACAYLSTASRLPGALGRWSGGQGDPTTSAASAYAVAIEELT